MSYTGDPANGIILTAPLPADNTKLTPEVVNVPIRQLFDNCAAFEIGVAAKAPIASPTFTGVVTFPEAPLLPGLANSGAVVSSGAFSMVKDGTIDAVIPVGTLYADAVVWTTPTQPFVIQAAIIQITGSAIANIDPGTVTLDLYVGTVKLIDSATMSSFGSGGTLYAVTGGTSNKTIFGLVAAERGSFFTTPPANAGQDKVGAELSDLDGRFAAPANGVQGWWGKDIAILVHHSNMGSAVALMIPYRVIILGRLL